MENFINWLSNPWPWYIAGPVIGLMVPLHLVLLNRTFGISSSFRHVCAAVIPNRLEFLQYNWKAESWNLMFAGGILLGAFIAAQYLSTDEPIALSTAAVERMHGFGITDLSGQHPVLSKFSVGHWSAVGKPYSWLFSEDFSWDLERAMLVAAHLAMPSWASAIFNCPRLLQCSASLPVV